MKKILIIDDEESICETLSWILEKEGYFVNCAKNFHDAIILIKDNDFDLYFIDLIIPGGSGIKIIEIIKKKQKTGKIVILTGYPDIPTLVDAIRLDTYDYIRKPINQNDLKDIIKHAFSH
ncbi:MAG: response regulator [Candidatus Helarchaeota archaeon]